MVGAKIMLKVRPHSKGVCMWGGGGGGGEEEVEEKSKFWR